MTEKLEIEYIPIADIIPYVNNPRKNDNAVDVVAKSIKEFGFNVPVILDKKNTLITGHTRIKAARKLGLTEVPVIWAEHLNEKQVKAFRIMDNKSQDYAMWDYNVLKEEIFELRDLEFDIDLTGFKEDEINFFSDDGNKANNPYEEWRKSGNIEYHNEDKSGFKTILVHFPDQASVESFAKLINQTITDKTKFIWYPKQAEDKVADLEYTDDNS